MIPCPPMYWYQFSNIPGCFTRNTHNKRLVANICKRQNKTKQKAPNPMVLVFQCLGHLFENDYFKV